MRPIYDIKWKIQNKFHNVVKTTCAASQNWYKNKFKTHLHLAAVSTYLALRKFSHLNSNMSDVS